MVDCVPRGMWDVRGRVSECKKPAQQIVFSLLMTLYEYEYEYLESIGMININSTHAREPTIIMVLEYSYIPKVTYKSTDLQVAR